MTGVFQLTHNPQAIEKPSIWGIFEMPLHPAIENIVDERVILIGDAAYVNRRCPTAHRATFLRDIAGTPPPLIKAPEPVKQLRCDLFLSFIKKKKKKD